MFQCFANEYGSAFHLGTIVRTLFVSFYLFVAGYGDGNLADYSKADLRLSELAMARNVGARYRLGAHAVSLPPGCWRSTILSFRQHRSTN
ncbi:hypothetical protein SAMN05192539_105712 [Paraburkholderia diazotrophica]|uniref:Uncharacterized protein n=1 Tax=Paraburkholderia diazotrophica TaxID=667676 RepID=A0A1H7EFA0_9BURK|nr:hypothetical protein SAMN05192539_105712 [Paraburkholderia diazotrophica]